MFPLREILTMTQIIVSFVKVEVRVEHETESIFLLSVPSSTADEWYNTGKQKPGH